MKGQSGTPALRPGNRILWVSLVPAACAPSPDPPELQVPPRSPDAPGGAEVSCALREMDLDAREGRIYAEITGGNVPGWFRRLEAVEVAGTVRGVEHRIRFWVTPGDFVAGHKLDVVITPFLSENRGKVAVYGHHTPGGEPIQPLYTGSSDTKVLFRDGIRIVHRRGLVDGVWMDLPEALADPALAPPFSEEGVISAPRYPVSPPVPPHERKGSSRC